MMSEREIIHEKWSRIKYNPRPGDTEKRYDDDADTEQYVSGSAPRTAPASHTVRPLMQQRTHGKKKQLLPNSNILARDSPIVDIKNMIPVRP